MKTRFEKTTYSLPVYWASYLINGDASGLENGEQAEIDTWLASLPYGFSCVNVSEESNFRHSNDATNLGGDCADYAFLRNRNRPGGRLVDCGVLFARA